jgi:putative peptidoglycan lipid II flippase
MARPRCFRGFASHVALTDCCGWNADRCLLEFGIRFLHTRSRVCERLVSECATSATTAPWPFRCCCRDSDFANALSVSHRRNDSCFSWGSAKGLRLVLFLTLPSAVGLCLLAHEIVSILFEHGKFTSADVDATAGPLQAYAFGLVFYSSIKVLQPAFYTIGKRFVPMLVSLGIIVFTATVNAITVFVLKWDHTALAWATAAGLLINFSALYINMSRVAGGLETRLLLTSLTKLSMGLVGMAVICLLAKISVLSGWSSMSFMMQTLSLGGTVLVAAGVYFFLTQKLGVEEAREFLSIVSRRFKR